MDSKLTRDLAAQDRSPIHRLLGRLSLPVLAAFVSGAIPAHEPAVLPVGVGDAEPRLLPIVSAGSHLAFSTPALAFDDVLVESSRSLELHVTNASPHLIDVTFTTPGDIAVSQGSCATSLTPTGFSLATEATACLAVIWTPTASGPLDGELAFAVRHAGVRKAETQAIGLSGFAGAAARLRFDVPTFGQVDVAGTEFGLASVADADTPPKFEMTITNVGGLPARDLRVVIEGPGAILPAGVCHEGLDEAGICIAEVIGRDQAGNPIIEPHNLFGDLAPGASVTALWSIVPANAGLVEKPFDVRFATGSEASERNQTFNIAGECIPFTFPGDGFLRVGEGGGGTDGFGAVADPLDDPLGTLRPTGFDARTVFSLGEVDAIDLRSGGITLVVPIGGPQAVRGPLAYELNAVFSSHIWHRRTLAEVEVLAPISGIVKPLHGLYPNPVFNLGTGWSFHLGRLVPPYVFDSVEIDPVCPDDPLFFQRKVDSGPRFVYIDANGTQHEFWRQLHGEENPDPEVRYDEKPVLYARDGSYLRLVLDPTDPDRRWIEEPSGIKRLFVRQTGALEPTLPDEWLLESIEDPYDNTVTIEYGTVTVSDGAGGGRDAPGWTIRDHENDNGSAWRTVKVAFGSWAGRTADDPMVVEQVDLPGFDGGEARSYRFAYTDQALDYPPNSVFHDTLAAHCPGTDLTVRMPRLDRVDLPDGSAYAFAYANPADDVVRLQSATLPTGATIDYQYAAAWDSPPDCKNSDPSQLIPFNGVSRRTVTEVGSAVLEDRRYLRQTLRTDDVPDSICQHFDPLDFSSTTPPFTEQTVAVWSEQQNGLSSVLVHHFNVYPFDDTCQPTEGDPTCDGGRLESGRTHIERNLKISHSADADPRDATLKLSEELYSCEASIDGITVPRSVELGSDRVGDDIAALTDSLSCSKRETTYARYEVSRAGRGCRQQSSAHCLRDSRLMASRTYYENDTDNADIRRWIKTVNSDFDGLGHYRRTETWSNFQTASATSSRLEQTTFQNWNPGAGTLTLRSDHTVAQSIAVPSTWLLDTWDHHWTLEGSAGRGGEACFDPQRGHLTHERTWAATAVNTNIDNVGANRGEKDLVVRHEVPAATGELELLRYFGADTFDLPTDDGWCASPVWVKENQDYALDHDYAFGHVQETRVVGASVYDLRRSVDQGTGWPKTETLNSGEVVSFDYDPMGRTTWSTSAITASQRVDYQQQADGRWELTATVYPKGTTAATEGPKPIRSYQATYDGLGRLSSETLPRYDDDADGAAADRKQVTRNVFYHPSGNVHRVTALDNPARDTQIDYDFRGRPSRITQPDRKTTSAREYTGVRKTVLVACVKTGGTTSSGICQGSGFEKTETKIERDWKGRTIKVTAPLHDDVPGGFETTFSYDPLDNRTAARRTQREGGETVAQTRSWTFDGRGFLTRESHPERVPWILSDFTTRGLPRTVIEHSRAKTLSYDRLGRLRQIATQGRALKRFVYCDREAADDPPGPAQPLCSTEGPENGQLIVATRNNYRRAGESGVRQNNLPVDATWVVTSTFDHDAAGRRSGRSTGVFAGLGWSSDPQPFTTVTTFDQSWTHDDLGNVTVLGYPTCDTASADCVSGRAVQYTYRQGFYLTAVVEGTLGANFTYHPSGLVHEVRHKGGGGTDRYGVALGMPRIASLFLGDGSGQDVDLGTVSYDFAGNITAIGTDVFAYDKNSRLKNATVRGSAFAYQYDNFDNHRDPSLPAVFPSNNRLFGGDWRYDAWGNLTSGEGHTYVYDELDKVSSLREASGIDQLGFYDHDDLRILTLRPNDPMNPELTWTLRDGMRVIREFAGVGGAIDLRKDYVYAGTRLIASRTTVGASATERHYHQDQVGNARLITGHNARQVHYQPFGEALAGTASGERAVGFQGHENDGLTTYMRGRTYLPFAHRFSQVDPARDAAVWSQYTFAGNNPILHRDETGLCIDGCVVSGPIIVTAAAGTALVAFLSSQSAVDPDRTNGQVISDQIVDGLGAIRDGLAELAATAEELSRELTQPAPTQGQDRTKAPGNKTPPPTVPGKKPKETPNPELRPGKKTDPRQPPTGADIPVKRGDKETVDATGKAIKKGLKALEIVLEELDKIGT